MDSAKLCLDCDVFVLNNLNFFQDAYLYGEIFDFVAVGCLTPWEPQISSWMHITLSPQTNGRAS